MSRLSLYVLQQWAANHNSKLSANEGFYLCQGYLKEKVDNTWHTNWYILKSHGLACYDTPQDEHPKAVLRSKEIVSAQSMTAEEAIQKFNDSDIKFGFKVNVLQNKYGLVSSISDSIYMYYFVVDTEKEKDDWINAFNLLKESSKSHHITESEVEHFLDENTELEQLELESQHHQKSLSNEQSNSRPSLDAEEVDRIHKFFNIPSNQELLSVHSCSTMIDGLENAMEESGYVSGYLCLFRICVCFMEKVPKATTLKKEGTLEVLRGGRKRKWKRRYFMADFEKMAMYEDEHGKESYSIVSHGLIPFVDVHSVNPYTELERPHGFQIITSKETFTLSTEDDATAQDWISFIQSRLLDRTSNERNITAILPIRHIADIKLLESNMFPNGLHIDTLHNKQFIFAHISDFEELVDNLFAFWNRMKQDRTLSIDIKEKNDDLRLYDDVIEDEMVAKDPLSSDSIEFQSRFNFSSSELLYHTFSCSMLRSMLVRGTMYVSQNYCCFYSNWLGITRVVVIPFRDILEIKKEKKLVHLMVNSIIIKTAEKEFVFANFVHRHEAVESLRARQQSACSIGSIVIRDEERYETSIDDTLSGNLNITMLVVGSRGDVQPFISLALGLEKSGHKVRLATHEAHRKFVGEWGIEFFPLAGDPKELMKLCVENDSFSVTFMKDGIAKFGSFVSELLVSCWEATKEGTDVIIQNPPAMAGPHLAEKLRIPLFGAFPSPWSRTTKFPHPFATSKRPMGSYYNYSTYVAVEQAIWLPNKSRFNEWRKKYLDLPPLDILSGGHSIMHDRQVPYLYCWSPSVLPKPSDWPDYLSVTGYWFLDSPEFKPSQELEDFVSREPKPIYIGFGSVTVEDPDELTRTIIESLQKTGQRAVIVKGWGGVSDIEFPENVLCIESAPHDWLFPRMSAVIHHGGAGTVAAGLRAGIPTLVIPFFGDQHFWASLLVDIGVGIPPLTIKGLTVEKFARALIQLTEDEKLKDKCAILGEQIRAQDGVGKAVEHFNLYTKRQLHALHKKQ